MNNKEYIATLASKTRHSNNEAQSLVRTFIDEMVDLFENGNSVSIPQLGTFEVKKRLERVVINPGTSQKMLVPPKLVVAFKPSTAIKEKYKGGVIDE